ncbi:alpha/beta fold hydrolase [Rhodobacteraceae bacterium HSP-20]|uniref:Alpha/beta fold hydrolase n=1 Tax=Paragemmobacter amnigenus TaxID=2852097 RepID=A0ABS6J4Q7_9RHOB|nr:alpha/beta fold hydrolase [Rhodobacter amnigenus]MBU9698735.1 alpha/beta fold hydrolase [Rhodobacter amnigenus]MBV4389962.1 alpha/beta fold hydrolase [Rhodobacter amnigenus]
MAEAILVPQVGQDLTEAKVVELHVKLGDKVKKGDLVAVVESEKASFEVEAFSEGVVISLPWKVGDVATVLEPLMHVGAEGEVVAAAKTAVPDPVQTAVPQTVHTPATVPVSATPAPVPTPAPAPAPVEAAVSGGDRASPVARRMAADHGLSIGRIAGTGPRGAVVLRDVAAAVAAAPAGGALELRTLQSGQGTPVVFIHGFGADLSSWRPLVARIGLGSPMMALDLPGHGGSQGHGAADFAALVDAVGATLRSLHGGVHLVGHSLGAAVAAALTERGDLDVRSLTLIAPAGLGASVDGDFVDGFLSARSEGALAAWMRRLVSDPASLAPVLVRATLAARDEAGLVPAQTRVARGVFEGSTQLFNVAAALRAYRGPCSVIAGRDDAIVPLREIEAAVPAHVALHRLDRVGHLPQVEAADLVQTVIARTVRSAG